MRSAGDRCWAGDMRRAGDVTWTPTNMDRDSVCLALRTNGRLKLKAYRQTQDNKPPSEQVRARCQGIHGFLRGSSAGAGVEIGITWDTRTHFSKVRLCLQCKPSRQVEWEWKTPLPCVFPSSWWCMNLGSLSKSESYFCFTVLVGRGISSTFHLAFPSPNLLFHTSENQCPLLRMSLQSKDSRN